MNEKVSSPIREEMQTVKDEEKRMSEVNVITGTCWDGERAGGNESFLSMEEDFEPNKT